MQDLPTQKLASCQVGRDKNYNLQYSIFMAWKNCHLVVQDDYMFLRDGQVISFAK